MSTAITTFTDKVREDLPGCPYPLITDAVISTLIRFCREAEVWRYKLDNVDLTISTAEYTFSPPAGTRIHRILNVSDSNGVSLTEKNEGWLDENVTNWRTDESDTLTYYASPETGTILVVSVPEADVTGGLTNIRVLLIPTRDATTVDDILYNDYRDEIVFGVKAWLMRMPNKSWTDKESAKEYEGWFMAGIKKAYDHVNKGVSGKSTKFGRISYS